MTWSFDCATSLGTLTALVTPSCLEFAVVSDKVSRMYCQGYQESMVYIPMNAEKCLIPEGKKTVK